MKRGMLVAAAIALAVGFRIVALAADKSSSGGMSMDKQTRTLEQATFAGGCFWCTESDFEKVDGVVEVVSGYTGGTVGKPSYEQVSAGGTGHVEAVQVTFDPARVSYKELLDYFWKHIDPTDPGGQFVDRGKQYRSVIYYHSEAQRQEAEASKTQLQQSGRFQKPIATEILPLKAFFRAEEYHQDYYKKNPIRYKYYRWNSGRDQFLSRVWEKTMEQSTRSMHKDPGRTSVQYARPSDEELRKRLSPLQFKVARLDGTEPPFNNEYWDNKEPGIYVDIVSGEPLFSSLDKYDSGTGWPSFTKPLEPANLVERQDRGLFMTRTEVRSRHGDSHLGHVFPDGPPPTGLRYCMNSASLRFIPAADLEKEGYGGYTKLFGVK